MAPVTGAMLYITEVAPHCPDEGPAIAAGFAGTPPESVMQRCKLAYPQALIAVTHNVDPFGIDPGNKTEQDVPFGDNTAPATEHVQV